MTDNLNTWYKLKDGTWGAKLRVVASEGECVMLTNKKGEETPVWLVKKIAQFPDASLWSCTSEEPAHTEELVEEPF